MEADKISQFPNNWNKHATPKSYHLMKNTSEPFDTSEFTENNFPMTFNIVY